MTTLGQMLQANLAALSKVQAGQLAYEARKAQQVEQLRQSFVHITEKAKRDIARAIRKGRTPGNVNSYVSNRQTCFAYLNRALASPNHQHLRTLEETSLIRSVVAPVWDAFIAWAEGEQLSIRLQGRATRIDGITQQAVLIKAEAR